MANSWENLLKYLLAVNSVVAQMRNDKREETTDDLETDAVPQKDEHPLSFEDINARIIAFNELVVGSDQVFIPYRGLAFLSYMISQKDFGVLASEYIRSNYGGDSRRFVFDILNVYVANNPKGQNNLKDNGTGLPIDTTFIYYPKEDTLPMFQSLSGLYPNGDPEKLLSVRKFPFYATGNNTFFLLDNTFLNEKLYGQFINDFWFDVLKGIKDDKGKAVFDIRYYRAVIGDFFEKYISERF